MIDTSGYSRMYRNIYAEEVLIPMPLDTETYHANAKQCEDRAEQMPPALRRDLLMAAQQWRKLASLAEKRDLEKERSEQPQ